MKRNGTLEWIKDQYDSKLRTWEEFYRNRWQYDKVVRSTHGVNCTGGCTWQIHVKDGIVTWEMQGLDYPSLEAGLPGYEPRGCQRGISFSWYLYSPLRVKYPYARGALWICGPKRVPNTRTPWRPGNPWSKIPRRGGTGSAPGEREVSAGPTGRPSWS